MWDLKMTLHFFNHQDQQNPDGKQRNNSNKVTTKPRKPKNKKEKTQVLEVIKSMINDNGITETNFDFVLNLMSLYFQTDKQ